jgi:hypothetical protein
MSGESRRAQVHGEIDEIHAAQPERLGWYTVQLEWSIGQGACV